MSAVNGPSRVKVVKHLGTIGLNYAVRIKAAAANTTASLLQAFKILQHWTEDNLFDTRCPVGSITTDCLAVTEEYKAFCKSNHVLVLVTRLLKLVCVKIPQVSLSY